MIKGMPADDKQLDRVARSWVDSCLSKCGASLHHCFNYKDNDPEFILSQQE